jgi:LacI family transcriptional regulator
MEDPTEKRATLRSLAEITGLGISTVSQALRDSPEIAIETRKRVRLAAQQAGYRPNRAGVRLRTGKSNVIALVLNPQDGGSGFFSNIIYGISDALSGTAYHLVVTPYSLSDPMEPVRYIVETNSADGVIISRTQQHDQRVSYMTENNINFVTHGRTDMGVEHAYYDYDNEAFAYDALRRLKEKGRDNIALMSPPPTLNYYQHTLKGFDRGLVDFGLNGFLVGATSSDSHDEELMAAGFEMSQRKTPPGGVICASASMALAVNAGLAKGGMKVGDSFDMVVKSVNPLLHLLLPEIIGINEDYRKAGFELGKMIIARIAGTKAVDLQVLELPRAVTEE